MRVSQLNLAIGPGEAPLSGCDGGIPLNWLNGGGPNLSWLPTGKPAWTLLEFDAMPESDEGVEKAA